MKHIKKYNESVSHELFLTGQTRYSKLYYGHIKGKLVLRSDENGISFQTDEQGVSISDVNKLEELIEFLMYHRDKSI